MQIRISSSTISIGIILVITVFGLYVTSAIWQPGILLNGDHSGYEMLYQCMQDQGVFFITGDWCPQLPQWSHVLTFYPPVFYTILYALSSVLGTISAYKIMTILTWFLIPLVLASFLIWHEKYIAAPIAFSLTLFFQASVGTFGFDYVFLWGGPSLNWGFALLFVNMWFAMYYVKEITLKKTLVLVSLAALLFLSHFLVFIFYFYSWLYLVIIHYKILIKHWKHIVLAMILITFLVSVWFIPTVFKTTFLKSSGVLARDINASSPGLWTSTVQMWERNDEFPLYLVFLGCFGFFWGLLKKTVVDVFNRMLAGIFVGVFLLSVIPGLYFVANPIRLGPLLVLVFCLGTALLVDQVLHLKKVQFSLALQWFIAIIIGFILLIQPVQSVMQSSKFLISSGDTRYGSSFDEVYASVVPMVQQGNGRLLIEDSYSQIAVKSKEVNPMNILATTRLWTPLPVLTGKEAIFVFANVNDEGKLKIADIEPMDGTYVHPLIVRTSDELVQALDYLNVDFMLVSTPLLSKAFAGFKQVWKADRFELYYRDGASSYFALINKTDGTLTNEEYTGRIGVVTVKMQKEGKLLFKQGMWPNWQASVDNHVVSITKDPQGFFTVDVPKGTHKVEMRFVRLWYEILGVVLFLIGLLLVVGLLVRNPKI